MRVAGTACVLLCCTLLLAGGMYSHADSSTETTASTASEWPGLRLQDARIAMKLLRDNKFLQWQRRDGGMETLVILPISATPAATAGRWHILMNGQVLDFRDYFIAYKGTVMNLGTLFTYAEEHRPEDFPRTGSQSFQPR